MNSRFLCAMLGAVLPSAAIAQLPPRPVEAHDFDNYADVVAGEHLQGYAAHTKWGIVLRNPIGARPDWPNFDSAVVITNPESRPSPGTPNNNLIKVDLFNPNGVLVSTTSQSVAAEGQMTVPASAMGNLDAFGFGVVAMSATDPAVGGVAVGASIWPSPTVPGRENRGDMRSWQGLQVAQRNTSLFLGPFSLQRTSTRDELAFSYGLGFAINPNSVPNQVRVELWADGSMRTSRTTTIAGGGAALLDDVWNWQRSLYLNQIPLVMWGGYIKVVSLSNLPLIGEFFHLDVTEATNPGAPGVPRLASAMAAIAPARYPTCPEVTSEVLPGAGQPRVETLICLANVSGSSAAVTIKYIDEDTQLRSTVNLTIPNNSTQFVGPGVADATLSPRRWRAEIATTSASLIGWTLRSGNFPAAAPQRPHPLWGESLNGLNGLEPGIGFKVDPQEFLVSNTLYYQVGHKTLALRAPDFVDGAVDVEDPGYCTLRYLGPSATASFYQYRYLDGLGTLMPATAPSAGQFFYDPSAPGALLNGFVAFTFEDPMFRQTAPAVPTHLAIVATTNPTEISTFRWTGIWTTGPLIGDLALPFYEGQPGQYGGGGGEK